MRRIRVCIVPTILLFVSQIAFASSITIVDQKIVPTKEKPVVNKVKEKEKKRVSQIVQKTKVSTHPAKKADVKKVIKKSIHHAKKPKLIRFVEKSGSLRASVESYMKKFHYHLIWNVVDPNTGLKSDFMIIDSAVIKDASSVDILRQLTKPFPVQVSVWEGNHVVCVTNNNSCAWSANNA
jgi:hypothetical protein